MAAGAGLRLKHASACRRDLVSLGEVMLRLDPGEGRIATARQFRAWEGGGEYNVARNLARCFGLRTAIVTALADNPVGRLVHDLMLQGGVDTSLARWVEYDGVGRAARNGLNFVERGFGLRGALGCSDRGHTAVSQLEPGQIDWEHIFGPDGARWFHTGGIFCGLSATTPAVAREAMVAARKHGTIVSYDLNYRESLWRAAGGRARADAVNRELLPLADVLLGAGPELERTAREFPNLSIVATTLRAQRPTGSCEWGAACLVRDAAGGRLLRAPAREVAVLDRVGAGDAFGAGLIYGVLSGKGAQYGVECGATLGALAMTTPGDGAQATLAEIEALMEPDRAEAMRR
jgi:2-dehydro-3-deoxygluconokinase